MDLGGPTNAYLTQTMGPILTKCLAEVVSKQPADPIEWIAHWLYQWSDNEHYFYEKSIFLKEVYRMKLELSMAESNRCSVIRALSSKIADVRKEVSGAELSRMEVVAAKWEEHVRQSKIQQEAERERKREQEREQERQRVVAEQEKQSRKASKRRTVVGSVGSVGRAVHKNTGGRSRESEGSSQQSYGSAWSQASRRSQRNSMGQRSRERKKQMMAKELQKLDKDDRRRLVENESESDYDYDYDYENLDKAERRRPWENENENDPDYMSPDLGEIKKKLRGLKAQDVRRNMADSSRRASLALGTTVWCLDCNLGLVCQHTVLGNLRPRSMMVHPESPEVWESRNFAAHNLYDHEVYSNGFGTSLPASYANSSETNTNTVDTGGSSQGIVSIDDSSRVDNV